MENPGITLPISSVNATSVRNSDWTIIAVGIGSSSSSNTGNYWLWVNGTSLSPIVGSSEYPFPNAQLASPFPYSRLATTSPAGSTAFYLYHQVSTNTFAEDVWDVTLSAWSSSNISISTS